MGCCAFVSGVVGIAGSWFSWLGVCWVYGRLVDGLQFVVLGTVNGWEAQSCVVMAWNWFIFGVRCMLLVAALVAGLAGCIVMCILLWVAEAWLGVTTKGFCQNWLQFFCKVGWVVVCSILEVIGSGRMVGLVSFINMVYEDSWLVHWVGHEDYGWQREELGWAFCLAFSGMFE